MSIGGDERTGGTVQIIGKRKTGILQKPRNAPADAYRTPPYAMCDGRSAAARPGFPIFWTIPEDRIAVDVLPETCYHLPHLDLKTAVFSRCPTFAACSLRKRLKTRRARRLGGETKALLRSHSPDEKGNPTA
jgi:hypothetical protein